MPKRARKGKAPVETVVRPDNMGKKLNLDFTKNGVKSVKETVAKQPSSRVRKMPGNSKRPKLDNDKTKSQVERKMKLHVNNNAVISKCKSLKSVPSHFHDRFEKPCTRSGKLNQNLFVDEQQQELQPQLQPQPRGDGIVVDITADEELDYEFTEEEAERLMGDSQFSEMSEASDEDVAEISADQTPMGDSQTSSQTSEEKLLLENPGLKDLFNRMLDERIQQAAKQGESSSSRLLTTMSPATDNKNRGRIKIDNAVNKSPSDTTIYAPALKKRSTVNQMQDINMFTLQNHNGIMVSPGVVRSLELDNDHNSQNVNIQQIGMDGDLNESFEDKLIKKVNNFVESVRAELNNSDAAGHSRGGPVAGTSQVVVAGLAEAQRRSDNAVIEAEKFRASVAVPPGECVQNYIPVLENGQNVTAGNLINNSPPIDNQVGNGSGLNTNLTDDDFFHLICHIDVSLKQKIEKGDYVDLDKLLPQRQIKSQCDTW